MDTTNLRQRTKIAFTQVRAAVRMAKGTSPSKTPRSSSPAQQHDSAGESKSAPVSAKRNSRRRQLESSSIASLAKQTMVQQKFLKRGKVVRNNFGDEDLRQIYDRVETKSHKPIERLRRIVKSIRIFASICLELSRYAKQQAAMELSFFETNLQLKEEYSHFLSFNPDQFRGNNAPKCGERLRKILAIPPSERSPGHIQKILALLRTNTQFQDYSIPVQIQLSKCMYFQRYEAQRVVLREGHRADCFYLIVSGSVLINTREIDPRNGNNFIRTVHEMSQGDSFGELALMTGSVRTCSVVTKTDVELLAINKDDFDKIIKEPLIQQRQNHLDYLRNLPLFAFYPVQILEGQQNHFNHQYFSKNKLVISNSYTADFLVIIKSGTCKVICELTDIQVKNEETRCHGAELGRMFPMLYRQNSVSYAKKSKVQGDIEWKINQIREIMRMNLLMGNTSTDRILRDVKQKTETREREHKERSETDNVLNEQRPSQRELVQTKEINKLNLLKNIKHEDNIVFAQVATLGPGSVFGLESLFQRTPSRLILISNGAECLMLSKKMFLKHCNTNVLRVVSDMIIGYPNANYVKQELREAREWERFKQQQVAFALTRNQQHSFR